MKIYLKRRYLRKMVLKRGAMDRYRNVKSSFADNQTPKTTIFYYTSTGNSLWIARALARELGNAELVSIIDRDKKQHVTWLNHCEQCLACIQWCPQEALQYGKKTPAYERYHHPEIKLQDLLR